MKSVHEQIKKSTFFYITMAPVAMIMLGEPDVAKLISFWFVFFYSTSWATCNYMDTAFRWKLYRIDWEGPEVQEIIKHTIDFLTRDAVAKRVVSISPTGVVVERNQTTVVQDVSAQMTRSKFVR